MALPKGLSLTKVMPGAKPTAGKTKARTNYEAAKAHKTTKDAAKAVKRTGKATAKATKPV